MGFLPSTMTKMSEFKPNWVSTPGSTLRDVMARKRCTQKSLSAATGISRRELREILRGLFPIKRKHALAFERVLGAPASFWLRREQQYTSDLKRLGLERGK